MNKDQDQSSFTIVPRTLTISLYGRPTKHKRRRKHLKIETDFKYSQIRNILKLSYNFIRPLSSLRTVSPLREFNSLHSMKQYANKAPGLFQDSLSLKKHLEWQEVQAECEEMSIFTFLSLTLSLGKKSKRRGYKTFSYMEEAFLQWRALQSGLPNHIFLSSGITILYSEFSETKGQQACHFIQIIS